MPRKQLLGLLACLFVMMIGFGITLPVLSFCVERRNPQCLYRDLRLSQIQNKGESS
jgi:hypothetical protein